MTPYRKSAAHSAVWYVTLVDRDGRKHRVSTGTHDAETAQQMEDMLRTFTRRGARQWDLIHALITPDPRRPHRRRLALDRLYDHWAGVALAADGTPRTLDDLRAELADVDLAPLMDAWLVAIAGTLATTTVAHYRHALGRLAPVDEDGVRLPLARSALTTGFLSAARDALHPGVPGRLSHLTAWSSCCRWLVERGALPDNPVTRITWPTLPKGRQRVRFIARLADVQRFVAAFPTIETRAIAALRESTGADWDGIEPMRREHIADPDQRLVYLPGDKTDNRPREVEVEPWAWPHVAAYLAATPQMPGAPLFTIDYDRYKRTHDKVRRALIAVGVAIPKGYSPHNARHSFAVRKRRGGWSDWKIAAYLGNTAQQVADVYGKFQPTREDLRQDRASGQEG